MIIFLRVFSISIKGATSKTVSQDNLYDQEDNRAVHVLYTRAQQPLSSEFSVHNNIYKKLLIKYSFACVFMCTISTTPLPPELVW